MTNATDRLTATALGLVRCPPWCEDDHADIDVTSDAMWHCSAPVGGAQALDGDTCVCLRQLVPLDTPVIEVDELLVRLSLDDIGDNYPEVELTPAAARELAAALTAAAAAAEAGGRA